VADTVLIASSGVPYGTGPKAQPRLPTKLHEAVSGSYSAILGRAPTRSKDVLIFSRDAGQLESAFDAATREHADVLHVWGDPVAFTHRGRIAELAMKHRLPTMHFFPEAVEAGGLLGFGPNQLQMWRKAGRYVDKILKGAKPADIPVEQPTKYELIINLKTAKALGLTIPSSLLQRADQVIE
jgi:putative ABC transport system substrate-binding protein